MAAGDPTAVRASGLRPGFYALAVFVAGALLAAVSFPQFVAALARVAGDPVVAAIGAGDQVDDRRVARALRSRVGAAKWWPIPQDKADLALLQLWQARQMDLDRQSGQRRLMLDRAVDSARQAIALDAGNPYLWMRLAEGLFLRDGLSPAMAAAVTRSMVLGPTAQPMILPRLEMAFMLDARLTDDQHAVVAEQIRLAALWHPDWLVAYARQRYALGIVRRALAATPDRLATFDRLWDETRPGG